MPRRNQTVQPPGLDPEINHVRSTVLISSRTEHARGAEKGSILIGVLWCVVLLAVIVIGLLHTTRLDLMVGKYHTDRIQAHYLALAGIEKAKALLHQNAIQRSRSGLHHSAELFNAPGQFRDTLLGRGKFRVIRPGQADEGGGTVYGVTDEESRLNINTATPSELTKIVGLTPDVAAAIVDWRDGDNAVTAGGAESPYYASLQPPYRPRNGPFPTIRELLMVRGVSRELLFGDSFIPSPNQSALPERTTSEMSPKANLNSRPTDDSEFSPESGWAAWFTAFSSVQNMDASGVDRINLQTADVAALTGVRGVTPEIARAIVAYRGQNQLQSVADLLDVTAARPGGRGPANQQPAGPKVINDSLFREIADHFTVEVHPDLAGLINVNTASVEVLVCLPGVDRPLAQAIVAQRRAQGFFPSVAALLDVPGLSRDRFKQLVPRVTVRSETFRILSEGRAGSAGTRQRIEAVVHIGLRSVTTLAYREDDL